MIPLLIAISIGSRTEDPHQLALTVMNRAFSRYGACAFHADVSVTYIAGNRVSRVPMQVSANLRSDGKMEMYEAMLREPFIEESKWRVVEYARKTYSIDDQARTYVVRAQDGPWILPFLCERAPVYSLATAVASECDWLGAKAYHVFVEQRKMKARLTFAATGEILESLAVVGEGNGRMIVRSTITSQDFGARWPKERFAWTPPKGYRRVAPPWNPM